MNVESTERASPTPQHPRRILGLDALRGVAALAVVVYHYTSSLQMQYPGVPTPIVSFPYGGYGVTLFFLISGFVIFMTVERSKRPWDFVVSRFSRIYPAYWASLLLTTAALSVFQLPDTRAGLARRLLKACANLTMVQGWFQIGSIDDVYWTLQVELSFYLIMLLLLSFGALDKAIPVFVGLTALGVVSQVFLPRPLPPVAELVKKILILDHVGLFLMGMCIYQSWKTGSKVFLLVLPFCLITPATRNYFPYHPALDTAVTAAFAAILFLAAGGRLSFLGNPVMVFLGTISYSLYLTHNVIGEIIITRLTGSGVGVNTAVALALAFSVALATSLTYLVEKPAMRVLRQAAGRPFRAPAEFALGPTGTSLAGPDPL